jgi:hypothetical protein
MRLAEEAKVTQGVISRAEDPDYGNLTLTTIGRIAAGYDLAAVIRFVPFSDLIRYGENTSEREFANLKTFEEENKPLKDERQKTQKEDKEEQEVIHAQQGEPKKDAAPKIPPQAGLSSLDTEGLGSQGGKGIENLEAAPFKGPKGEAQLMERLNAA